MGLLKDKLGFKNIHAQQIFTYKTNSLYYNVCFNRIKTRVTASL